MRNSIMFQASPCMTLRASPPFIGKCLDEGYLECTQGNISYEGITDLARAEFKTRNVDVTVAIFSVSPIGQYTLAFMCVQSSIT